jgi:hypothetical protein
MGRFRRGHADLADIGVGRPLYSFGTAWAPRKLVLTRTGRFRRQPHGSAQHLQFGVDVEAVARLDLDRGHALGDQGIDAGKGAEPSSARPRVADGWPGTVRDDAAAGAGDLLVAGAFEPHLELARAVAAVLANRPPPCGVAIDQL